jgi:hypothetical protein
VLVRGNDVQLSRLLQNLLGNARYFVGTEEVSLHQRDGEAIVEGADRGRGIQPEQIEEMSAPSPVANPPAIARLVAWVWDCPSPAPLPAATAGKSSSAIEMAVVCW